MKQIFHFFLLSIFISSCSNVTAPNTTVTPQATITFTVTLTSTITPTPNPMANAPEGATSVSQDGKTFYLDTTDNDVKYHYTWNEELEKWTREVGKLYLLDTPYTNYVPFTVRANSDVPDGQNLVSMFHQDLTIEALGGAQRYNPPPLSSIFGYELEKRYFNNKFTHSSAEQTQMQYDLQGKDNHHAYLPFISTYGETLQGRLSTETGFIMDIVNPADLESRVGNGVMRQSIVSEKLTFLYEVTGVDTDGNILIKIAYDGDLSTLTDQHLRWFLFEGVGNIIEREDQRDFQLLGLLVQGFASFSAKTNLFSNTQDVVIIRNP